MKKLFIAFVMCACALYFIAGCGAKEPAPRAPNAGPPAIMVDGILYYSTGEKVSTAIDESEFSGRITSTVPISQMPGENSQANIPFEGAPYAKCEDGIAVLMDDEWILFEARD